MKKQPPEGPKTHGSGVHNEKATSRYLHVRMNIPVDANRVPLHPEHRTPLTEEELNRLVGEHIANINKPDDQPQPTKPSNLVDLAERRNKKNQQQAVKSAMKFKTFKKKVNELVKTVGESAVSECLIAFGADINTNLLAQIKAIKPEDYGEVLELIHVHGPAIPEVKEEQQQVEVEEPKEEPAAVEQPTVTKKWKTAKRVNITIQGEKNLLRMWGEEKDRGTKFRKEVTVHPKRHIGRLINEYFIRNMIQHQRSLDGHHKPTPTSPKAEVVEYGGYAPPYDPKRLEVKQDRGTPGLTPSGQPIANFLEGGQYPPKTDVECNLAPILRCFINTVPTDKWPSDVCNYVVWKDDKPFVDSGKVKQAEVEGDSTKLMLGMLSTWLPYASQLDRENTRLFDEVKTLEWTLAHHTGDWKSADEIIDEFRKDNTSANPKPPATADAALAEFNKFKTRARMNSLEDLFGLTAYEDPNLGKQIREHANSLAEQRMTEMYERENQRRMIKLVQAIPAILKRGEDWEARRAAVRDFGKTSVEIQKIQQIGARKCASHNSPVVQKDVSVQKTISNVVGLGSSARLVYEPPRFSKTGKVMLKCMTDSRYSNPKTVDCEGFEFVPDDYVTPYTTNRMKWWGKQADRAHFAYLADHTWYGKKLVKATERLNKVIDVLNMDINPWSKENKAKEKALEDYLATETARADRSKNAEEYLKSIGFELL